MKRKLLPSCKVGPFPRSNVLQKHIILAESMKAKPARIPVQSAQSMRRPQFHLHCSSLKIDCSSFMFCDISPLVRVACAENDIDKALVIFPRSCISP